MSTPRELVEKWRAEAKEFRARYDASTDPERRKILIDAAIERECYARELEAALNEEGNQGNDHATKTT